MACYGVTVTVVGYTTSVCRGHYLGYHFQQGVNVGV
jgi:hypothetical protein